MRPRNFALVLLSAALVVTGCSSSQEASDDQGTDEGAVAGTVTWKGPKPGEKGQPLDKALVLPAWRNVKAKFYDTVEGYTTRGAASQAPPASEVETCLSVCPEFWGDLVCHYYCWHPSYSSTLKPNIRACFSGATRGLLREDVTPPRRVTYWEAYDHCVYQNPDWVNGAGKYRQATIDRNKTAGRPNGPLKWVEENEGDAFRYVMFTGFNPFAFDPAEEQALINEFYGITNPSDPAECRAKRRPRPTDPRDGTHCLPNKQTQLKDHPNFAGLKAATEAYARSVGGP